MYSLKVKRYLTVIFMVVVCYNGFSKDVDIPLITLQVDEQLKKSFYNTMLYLAENPGSNAGAIDFGMSILGPLGFSTNGSFLMFKNINDWLSIPFFGAGAIGFNGYSVSAGSGIIVKNRYFLLGFMAGLYIGKLTNNEHRDEGTTTTKFDFGLFPVFDVTKYPFVNLFLKQIDGFVYSNEPEVKDIRIETINYLLNISFKRFWRLSTLELYMRNGTNDFMYGYDLSKYTIFIENQTINGNYNTGSNRFSVTDSWDAEIYKTTSYGLRVGGDFLVVDLNYLTINDLVTYDSAKGGYYQYPFGLNGFPSITLNFSIERENDYSFGWFLHFSTLNQIGMSFVPEIGLIWQGEAGVAFITWTPLAIWSIGVKVIF